MASSVPFSAPHLTKPPISSQHTQHRAQSAQVYEPYDLTQRALKSLSLDDKLPEFIEKEIDDASIIEAHKNKKGVATLRGPGILGVCIPADRVPAFISAFKAAFEHRKQVRVAKAAHVSADKLIPRRKKNVRRGAASCRRRESTHRGDST